MKEREYGKEGEGGTFSKVCLLLAAKYEFDNVTVFVLEGKFAWGCGLTVLQCIFSCVGPGGNVVKGTRCSKDEWASLPSERCNLFVGL